MNINSVTYADLASNILKRLLLLSVAAQMQAEEPSRKESRELETRLKEQGKIQEIKVPK